MPNFNYTTINISGPTVPLQYAAVTGVDAAGEAVGYYGSSDDMGDSDDVGFTAVSGVVTTLDVPNASTADISGITASGEIFGNYTSTGNENFGFVVNHGAVDEFNVPFAVSTSLDGVNDDGVIYGEYEDGSDVVHGFIWNGGYVTVDVPGFTATSVSGVHRQRRDRRRRTRRQRRRQRICRLRRRHYDFQRGAVPRYRDPGCRGQRRGRRLGGLDRPTGRHPRLPLSERRRHAHKHRRGCQRDTHLNNRVRRGDRLIQRQLGKHAWLHRQERANRNGRHPRRHDRGREWRLRAR